jgi:hypothetical protein
VSIKYPPALHSRGFAALLRSVGHGDPTLQSSRSLPKSFEANLTMRKKNPHMDNR